MQATLKPDWPNKFPLRACAGTEFVKDKWIAVPPSHEREALRHEWLICRDDNGEMVSAQTATEAEQTPILNAEPQMEPSAPDYESMTKRELQMLAVQRHLEFHATANKAELVELLKG